MSEITTDERRLKRRPVKAIAAAAVDGELLFKCEMVDFTETGARLQGGEAAAPDRFQLIDIASGVAYSARVVWREAPALGVAFLHARSVEDASTPEWLVSLWRRLLTDPEVVGFAPSPQA